MKKIISFVFAMLFFCSVVQAKDIRFAQVTDLRFSNETNRVGLECIVNDINKQKDISFVVFTGDNINRANKDDLKAFLNKAKKLNAPFYVVIGERDVNKRKELGKKDYAKFVHKHVGFYKPKTPNYVFEKNGVVFIVVDGSKDVVNDTVGYYKDDVLEWLDANLELYSKKNVIILQHYPLIPPAEKELYYTYKPENYFKILDNHKNVKAVISGHFGVNKEIERNGVSHISTAPAPYYRIIDITDCTDENPIIWAEIRRAE